MRAASNCANVIAICRLITAGTETAVAGAWHPLLAELKCALVESLVKEIHAAALVWSESTELTDDAAGHGDLGSELSAKHHRCSTRRINWVSGKNSC